MASGFNSTGRLPVGEVPSMTQIFDKTRFIYYPPPAKKGGPGAQAPASDRLITDLTIHGDNSDFGDGVPQVKELWMKNKKIDPLVLRPLPVRTMEIEFNLNPKLPAKPKSSIRPGSAQPARPDSRVSFAASIGADTTPLPLSIKLNESISTASIRSAGASTTTSANRPHSARVRVDPMLAVTHPRSPRHRPTTSSPESPIPDVIDFDDSHSTNLFGDSVRWQAPQLISRQDRMSDTTNTHAVRRRNELHGDQLTKIRLETPSRTSSRAAEHNMFASPSQTMLPASPVPLSSRPSSARPSSGRARPSTTSAAIGRNASSLLSSLNESAASDSVHPALRDYVAPVAVSPVQRPTSARPTSAAGRPNRLMPYANAPQH
jgi:hypothetical protein